MSDNPENNPKRSRTDNLGLFLSALLEVVGAVFEAVIDSLSDIDFD
jgi:hypothetical protein